MKERVLEFIRDLAYNPKTAIELAEAMGIPEAERPEFLGLLTEMEAQGQVVRTRTQCYGVPERMNLAVGRLQGHPKGFGFLVLETPGQDDLFIGKENLGGAWNGDRVIARLLPVTPGGRREGEIIRVLERANKRIVGTFEAEKKSGYVRPDERRLPDDIWVPAGQTHGARGGEVVVVEVTRYPQPRRVAEGRIVERLGVKGAAGVDVLAIIRKYGLPEQFGSKAAKEAEAIPDEIPAEELAQRRDLRQVPTITIDSADAKDLDDAVSLERLPSGHWLLSVHIADVGHYVREDSPLDREAFARGTSVYLTDRVVPMLPTKLSNGVCSLNPQVDRLTLTCQMEIDPDGKIVKHAIFASVIRTAARMTYVGVAAILNGDAAQRKQYAALVPMLEDMWELTRVLRRRRQGRGSLDFDLPEPKVTLSPVGTVVDVRRAERTDADQVIEEFMLVANETVAEHMAKLKVPFCFRVHEEPAADRVAGLLEFLLLFGYRLKVGKKITPKALQQAIEWSRGRPEEGLLNSVLLRSMRQARYSAENIGHFGLAANYYCHFTSPIRRYPDLLVHRVLRAALIENSLKAKRKTRWQKGMQGWAEHCSTRERLAQDAERESVDLKKAEFMKDKVSEVFDGIITSVTGFGVFVQLKNTIEGLVHVSTMTDDYYHFQEKQYALIGERTRKQYRLGDAVTVRVVRVNVEERSIDFMLENKLEPARSRPAPEPEPARTARPEEPRGRQERGRQQPAAAAAAPAPKPNESKAVREAAVARARTRTEAAHPERVAKVVMRDMWGVPIPQRDDRPRRTGDEDTSIAHTMLRSIKLIDRRRKKAAYSGGGEEPEAAATAPAPAPQARPARPAPEPDGTGAVRRKPRRRGGRRRNGKSGEAHTQA